MIEGHEVEEIGYVIDQIVIRALLLTSNEQESDPQKIYNDIRLQELVTEPILALLFDNSDPETKNLFYSNESALGRCTKLLTKDDKAYVCKDCARDMACSLCEECFMYSNHVKHRFVPADETKKFFCYCGDFEGYQNSPSCCKHEIPNNSRKLPEPFVKRIRSIIKRLFKYLELLCGDESLLDSQIDEWLLMNMNFEKLKLTNEHSVVLSGVENETDAENAYKSCLLIFKTEDESREYVNSCVSFANPPGVFEDLLSTFESCGYLCVRYRNNDNYHATKAKIQKFIKDRLTGSLMYCRVVRFYRLFFMKLATILTWFISETCFKKLELCDLMSEVLFKETSLPETFFFNQNLCKDMRYRIAYCVCLPTLFTSAGALNFAMFYLQNFDRLYSEMLNKNSLNQYVFRLTIHFSASKQNFKYLVENGVLCMILKFISFNLKKMGFGRSKSFSDVMPKDSVKKICIIIEIIENLCEIIFFPVKSVEFTSELKSQLQKATVALLQFCADFDDIQPLTMKEIPRENALIPDQMCVVFEFHTIFMSFVALIFNYDGIANMIIREFVKVFKKDMEAFTANLSNQQVIERLLTLPDIENKPFSIFNLSKRLFFDILTKCVVKRTLSDELRETIFKDRVLLMWASQAAITSISFDMYYKSGRSVHPSNYWEKLLSLYRTPLIIHYLYMQDFNAIQFLISHLSPEHFFKYLLFNVCPSIREKTSVYEPVASILSLQEFEDCMVLQQVFNLIYNAITEMHLIGDLQDPVSYFIERQLIHMIADKLKTRKDLRNVLYVDRETFKSTNQNRKKINTIIIKISYPVIAAPNVEGRVLLPKYINPSLPFYFLNTSEASQQILKWLFEYYTSGSYTFFIPDVIELRNEFKNLDDFIFSETFLDFTMESFVKYYKNPSLWKIDSPGVFIFILLCLFEMIRVPRYRQISKSSRDRMFVFWGKHPKLENRTLLDIIFNDLPNSQNPLLVVMMNRVFNIYSMSCQNK
ncbi:E3 ubiquitin-protein ligase UBR1 [Thelohanellus kitauei]|uniref:E3 ubiquitin-protein ligase n=1 Tax=Thelohanellus kitauei TaxID=669202 RepID=A0A0C2IF16_THEKT|nr:E3 ubiquitin-protein ligase UBR1 [Thelohanellus kitauei]